MLAENSGVVGQVVVLHGNGDVPKHFEAEAVGFQVVIDAGAAHANLLGEPNYGAAFFLKVVNDGFPYVEVGKPSQGLRLGGVSCFPLCCVFLVFDSARGKR